MISLSLARRRKKLYRDIPFTAKNSEQPGLAVLELVALPSTGRSRRKLCAGGWAASSGPDAHGL
jgi:hypothetical protein